MTDITLILNQAIADAQELLTSFAFQDKLLGDLTTAFGDNYDREEAEDLVTQWQSGEFGSFPKIEIISSDTINGANGAYSVDTNKIYIAEEYLLANADNQGAIVDLVLEEYGHYVDDQINPVDAFGDEGALFSGLVQGQSFTDEQLQLLKAENDRAVVNLGDHEIAIEQQTFTSGSDNDDFRGTRGNDTYYFDADYELGSDVIAENSIALKTYHGKFLRAGNPDLPHGDTGWYINQVDHVNTWETFEVIPAANGQVALKTFHDRYLRAGNADENWLVNQVARNVTWEKFEVIPSSDGQVALKTFHDRYLRAGNANENWLVNQVPHNVTWEKFTPISQNSDIDTLDFSATTTQAITIDLSRYDTQTVNSNLTLRLDSALGIDIENVTGGSLNDHITGNNLDNILNSGAGNDVVNGGDGYDVAVYSQLFSDYDIVKNGDSDFFVTNKITLEQDRLTNIEEIQFTDKSYYIYTGGAGNDTILGRDNDEALFGNNGNDLLDAKLGDDTLDGGADNDTLIGGLGNDTLTGGTGSDTFVLNVNGYDVIKDFNQAENDKIDLTAVAANEIKLVTSGTSTIVQAKENVNGGFKDIATVENSNINSAIDSGDLIFVSESEQQALFGNFNSVDIKNISGLVKVWVDQFASSKGLVVDGEIGMAGVNFQLIDVDVNNSNPPTPPNDFQFDQSKEGNRIENILKISGTQGNQDTFETSITSQSEVSFGQALGVANNYSFSKTQTNEFSWNNSTTISASGEIFGIGVGAENTTDIGGTETTEKSQTFAISSNIEKTFGEVFSASQSVTETHTQDNSTTREYDINPESGVNFSLIVNQEQATKEKIGEEKAIGDDLGDRRTVKIGKQPQNQKSSHEFIQLTL